jgi:hypothetical protein
MSVVQDSEEPRAKIGSFLPQVDFAERAGKTVLDQIIGSDGIPHQGARITPQTRNHGFDLSLEALVDSPRPGPTRPGSRTTGAPVVLWIGMHKRQITHCESSATAAMHSHRQPPREMLPASGPRNAR